MQILGFAIYGQHFIDSYTGEMPVPASVVSNEVFPQCLNALHLVSMAVANSP
jgi:hypothetical protein